MNTIVIKLHVSIDLPLPQEIIEGAKKNSKNQKNASIDVIDINKDRFFEGVATIVTKMFEIHGFVLADVENVTRYSTRGGGYARYDTFVLDSSDKIIKLVVDIRIADHESHPSLVIKNEDRKKKLAEQFKEVENGTATAKYLTIVL